MPESILQKVLRSAAAAGLLYHRLVLLVGETGSGKSEVLKGAAAELGVPWINAGLELSRALLALTERQRQLHTPALLDELLDRTLADGQQEAVEGSSDGEIAVLDRLELLFEPALQQKPLRLLQGLSRSRTVLASWNGVYQNGKLIHAEPGHPEYCVVDAVDVLVVTMEGWTSIDGY